MGAEIERIPPSARCVILAGGELLDPKPVAALIRPGDYIICADSGYRHCEALGVRPHLLVGDFDSIGELPTGVEVFRVPMEKDFTDGALAAECALARGCGELLAVGMWGGRPDHALGNLQILAGLARRGVCCRMTDGVSEWNILHADTPRSFLLELREGCYFSVLAFSDLCENLSIKGGRYPLDGYFLRSDEARALSNEFDEGPVNLSWDRGTILIITHPLS